MSRRRRRQLADERVRRFKELPPEQAGLIMAVSISNALVSTALQIVLLVSCARAARRAVRARRDGRTTAHAVLTRPLVALACVNGLQLVLSNAVLPLWVDRVMRDAEHTQPCEDEPSSA